MPYKNKADKAAYFARLWRTSPKRRKKHRESLAKYRRSHADKIAAYNLAHREEARKRQLRWYATNRAHANKQSMRYYWRYKDWLLPSNRARWDAYVSDLSGPYLKHVLGISLRLCDMPPVLLEAKRAQLKIHRLAKEMTK